MPELNVSLPPRTCYVVRSHILPCPTWESNGWEEGLIIGAKSIRNQELTFNVLLKDGAFYEQIPLRYLSSRPGNIAKTPFSIYDCPSYNITFTEYDSFRGAKVESFRGESGTYIGTFDWFGGGGAEDAGIAGRDPAHWIQLDKGSYCLLPNTHVVFEKPYWTGAVEYSKARRYKMNRGIYRVEGKNEYRAI